MSRQADLPQSGRPKQNTMFGGVAILAMGIAVVKIIGALFKIPLFNVLGETGAADFNNAYSIYSVLLTVSTAGLPVALSKTVSEAHTLGRHNQKQKVFRVALSAFLAMGLASFAVMWFGSERLAGMMNNSHAALGIRALAPAVVCVGCLSAFRGYAQGHMNMTPTSVSQIIEALCKLFLGLALATYIMKQDLPGALAGEQTSMAAAGAITGVTVGTILALIYMIWNYGRTRRRTACRSDDRAEGSGAIASKLLCIAVPITLSTSLVPIINVLDNALVQGQLQQLLLENRDSWQHCAEFVNIEALEQALTAWAGTLAAGTAADMDLLSRQAAQGVHTAQTLMEQLELASRALYGNYAVAASLHNLPGSFMTALTAAIIPAVSASLARRDRKGSTRITGSVLRVTALLALPMGVGLTVLSGPIMKLLYPNYNVGITGPLLALLGPSATCVCLVLVTNSVLQSYGFVNLPIFTMLIGGAAKVIANYNLVAIPGIHIYGAPIGTLLCYGLALVLNLVVLRRVVRGGDGYLRLFGKPLAASVIMGAGAWAAYGLLARVAGLIPALAAQSGLNRMGNAVATFGAIGVAVLIYLVLVIALRVVSRDDVMLMPKGEKIAKVLHL